MTQTDGAAIQTRSLASTGEHSYGIRSQKAQRAFFRAAEEYRTIFDPAVNRIYGVKERRQEMIAILTATPSSSNQSPPAEPASIVLLGWFLITLFPSDSG